MGDTVAEVRAKRIFAHHDDLQLFRLEDTGNGFHIVGVRFLGSRQPQVPFATPVGPGVPQDR